MSDYCKVLIVDDELITRQGLKHMLLWEQEGFQIVGEASNGQEGLELIEKLQPHIVLADIVMPVLNGIDFSLILQEKYPDIRLIVLSSYDNFEYVKATLLNGAVDYVLKPTLSPPLLLEALQRAARSIPGLELRKSESVSVKKQLERYLAGYQEQLEERVFGEFFPHMQYRLLGVDLKSACGSNKKQADRMRDWIEESFKSQETYTQMSAFVEEEILCCLFNFRRKEEHLLLKDIRAAVHKVAQIEERVLFIISEPFTELAQVKKRYQQGICPYGKQKFYFPDTNLVFEKECTAAKEVERFDYDAYTACLNGRRYGEVLRLLKEYITYICEKHYDEYLVKNLTKNLLYNLLMEIEKYGISSDELKEEYFHRIDRAVSVDCFLEQCADIFGQLSGLIGQQIGDEDSRILEMKQYINRHYNEVLDLAEISQVFNFNYHYISTYFNQHIPEGFSGYLNKIRVAKACSLLRESTMTIAEVSGEVGYSDHSYFCRVFKKMTGHTPSQYRHSAKQGKL